jgi:DNA repair protein RadC
MTTQSSIASRDVTDLTAAQDAMTDFYVAKALEGLKSRMKRHPGEPIGNTPSDLRNYFRLLLAQRDREVFCVAFLNGARHLIEVEEMFYGTTTECAIYPKEVVKRALHHNAAAVVFAHNHPSGADPVPSSADERITEQLKRALAFVDVRAIDHIIVSGDMSTSMAERGLM